MGQRFTELAEKHIQFVNTQKLYFVATAAAEGNVNVSPKGIMDSLRVLGPNRVAWLNVTGSGNETSAHVQLNPRMTIMFCAFEGKPLILRLYGTAEVIHAGEPKWDALFGLFKPLPGARQIFDMRVELVQTSCGLAVPYFDYQEDRELLSDWAAKKGDAGIRGYWEAKNQVSIDGFATHILDRTEAGVAETVTDAATE